MVTSTTITSTCSSGFDGGDMTHKRQRAYNDGFSGWCLFLKRIELNFIEIFYSFTCNLYIVIVVQFD
ncbi:hypothetical protein T07_12107 [Trichinella nelsoni]|uniref:Uncharacterized protein n=1 Tax=Trichinella nelsoni TaxID=6336 RepID=A0A0V0RQZ0_9BILA|nr:hypothetical protein T07_12107 [Trichinella nelsoni]